MELEYRKVSDYYLPNLVASKMGYELNYKRNKINIKNIEEGQLICSKIQKLASLFSQVCMPSVLTMSVIILFLHSLFAYSQFVAIKVFSLLTSTRNCRYNGCASSNG